MSVLVSFYCDRLTDKTCVQNLLDGLVALTTFENFTGNNALLVSKRYVLVIFLVSGESNGRVF